MMVDPRGPKAQITQAFPQNDTLLGRDRADIDGICMQRHFKYAECEIVYCSRMLQLCAKVPHDHLFAGPKGCCLV